MQEQNVQKTQTKNTQAHKLELDRNHGASMTGVYAVPTFTDKSAIVKLKDETLTVSGQNLEIKILDVENGKLTISGTINSLRYSPSSAPTSFFKRILK
ncbi:MAG: sporulation protein YabP [Clostridia bacterium]|nr:sporulation protein YabP [Clostridia bacterium]